MKTFISELEQHKVMMERLADCSDAIEAADCQHIAGELVVRYEINRKALAASALTTDSSILTAHSNDYGFDTVYSRQVEAIASEKDCLIAISTSGASKNILNAVQAARLKAMAVIGLTGRDGGELSDSVIVPSDVTARIQEAHILIGHWWCGAIDDCMDAGDRATQGAVAEEAY